MSCGTPLQPVRRLEPVEVQMRDRGTVLNDFQGESVQSVNAGTQMPEHRDSGHLISVDSAVIQRVCTGWRGASMGAFAHHCKD